MSMPVLPRVSAAIEEHADWLEWQTLRNDYFPWSEHQRDLRIEGVDEARGDDDGDLFESLLDDVVAELTARQEACGGASVYPFDITPDGLAIRSGEEAWIYKFLLLLTLQGRQAGPPGSYGERLFEDLCAEAFATYLGKPNPGVGVTVFGFPRREEPRDFAQAVNKLCSRLGEGVCHSDDPRVAQQKDAKLDLVAWRRFPDSRPGKLVAFAQCATGNDWFEKIHELHPMEWCRAWLKEPPLVAPLACFFVPRRVERERWRLASIYGGVVFDRCRISWLVTALSPPLSEDVASWTRHALETGRDS